MTAQSAADTSQSAADLSANYPGAGVGAGAEAAGAGIGPGAGDVYLAAPAVSAEPPVWPVADYELTVNGARQPVGSAWIAESLLFVLRARLGLVSAKDGCSEGECGACTVLLDGQPATACLVPAVAAIGRAVETPEQFAVPTPDPVAAALAAGAGPGCGFCLPGIGMQVRALIARNPKPSSAAVREALAGNRCRCLSAEHFVAAAQKAAAQIESEAKAAAAHTAAMAAGFAAAAGQAAAVAGAAARAATRNRAEHDPLHDTMHDAYRERPGQAGQPGRPGAAHPGGPGQPYRPYQPGEPGAGPAGDPYAGPYPDPRSAPADRPRPRAEDFLRDRPDPADVLDSGLPRRMPRQRDAKDR